MTAARVRILMAAILPMIFCLSCDKWNAMQTVKKEAERFLEEFSVPTAQTANEWGMTEFTVFGRDRWTPFEIAAGSIALGKCSDTFDSCDVTIPFWCKGRDPNGRVLRLKRELHLNVQLIDDGTNAQVVSHYFTNDRSLTFFRQVLSWTAWSFLAPLCIFAFLVMNSGGYAFFDSSTMLWFAAITFAMAITLSGYAAYVSFGSTTAVILCLLIYLTVLGGSFLIYAAKRSAKGSLR